MLFEGNQAQVGPVIYMSDIKPCQWYSEEQPFFSLDSTIIWPFMDMRCVVYFIFPLVLDV